MGAPLATSVFRHGQVAIQSTQSISERVRVMVAKPATGLQSDASGSIVKPRRIKNNNSTAGMTRTPPNIELITKPAKAAAAGGFIFFLTRRKEKILRHHEVKKSTIAQREIKPHSQRICSAALCGCAAISFGMAEKCIGPRPKKGTINQLSIAALQRWRRPESPCRMIVCSSGFVAINKEVTSQPASPDAIIIADDLGLYFSLKKMKAAAEPRSASPEALLAPISTIIEAVVSGIAARREALVFLLLFKIKKARSPSIAIKNSAKWRWLEKLAAMAAIPPPS